MRIPWLFLLVVAMCASCTDQKLPLAPTTVAAPAPPPTEPSSPTTVLGAFAIAMPIDTTELAATAFGLAPFGYHGADHAEDGHPGWDIEYRVGGMVRAAAAGRVQSVLADAFTPGRFTVQLEHVVGTRHYRTVYTNLANLSTGIAPAESVRTGQALGTAGTISGTIGAAQITYAMTHFQLDDFESHRDLPNPNAVSPEPFLSVDAKLLLDRIWIAANYVHELVEPFITNPRAQSFPLTRTWTRAGGDGPAGIRFTRRNRRAAEYDYALLAESGAVTETGTVTLTSTARPLPFIDFVSPTSSRRLGVYDIVSDELRLTLAAPGAPRPSTLTQATVYRTAR